jgi:hypothetical protein
MNSFDKNRPYTSRKINPIRDKDYLNQINDYFEKPDQYLQVKDNIIVGKLVKGPKFDENKKPIPFSYIGNNSIFTEPKACFFRRSTLGASSKVNSQQVSTSQKKKSSIEDKPARFEILQHKEVEKIFENARNRIEFNKHKPETIEKFSATYDKFSMTGEKFKKQEKILEHLEDEQMRTSSVSKFLSYKTNKTEENLLMNKTDTFRKKRHVLEILESEKNLLEKFGNNNWLIDLRRPNKLERVRTAYVNICPNKNLLKFDQIHEAPKRHLEYVLRPESREQDKLLYNRFIDSDLKKNKLDPNIMEKMTSLTIEGKNLLEEEMKRSIANPGIKCLYRETEPLTNEETFKELYDETIYIHNKLFGLR